MQVQVFWRKYLQHKFKILVLMHLKQYFKYLYFKYSPTLDTTAFVVVLDASDADDDQQQQPTQQDV